MPGISPLWRPQFRGTPRRASVTPPRRWPSSTANDERPRPKARPPPCSGRLPGELGGSCLSASGSQATERAAAPFDERRSHVYKRSRKAARSNEVGRPLPETAPSSPQDEPRGKRASGGELLRPWRSGGGRTPRPAPAPNSSSIGGAGTLVPLEVLVVVPVEVPEPVLVPVDVPRGSAGRAGRSRAARGARTGRGRTATMLAG